MSEARVASPDRPRRGVIAWALYDWANSPFSTLIITFIFGVYFSRAIVGDEVHGQALWGYTVGLSGIAIALLSPVLGAVADAGGRRKPWLAAFTGLCVVATALMWYAEPGRDFVVLAMILVIVANVGFEFGIVFNNAMLPDLVPEARIGRWSGWAWSLGYFGGLAALVIALVAFVQAEAPLFGLDKGAGEHIRVVGPLVALWFVVFCWPLFVYTPDRPRTALPLTVRVREGLRGLSATFRNVRAHRNVMMFLLARLVYADGLATVFTIGVIFAAGTFAMNEAEVVMFGIVLNVTAGLGALGFAWVDDWLGSKRTIMISLIGMLLTGALALAARDVMWFWVAGAGLGIFLGPTQAASRSMMARLSPPELRTEFFGLYAFSGKATAFVGPILAGLVTDLANSQRAGMAAAVAFIAVGLVLLTFVRAPHRTPA